MDPGKCERVRRCIKNQYKLVCPVCHHHLCLFFDHHLELSVDNLVTNIPRLCTSGVGVHQEQVANTFQPILPQSNRNSIAALVRRTVVNDQQQRMVDVNSMLQLDLDASLDHSVDQPGPSSVN